ncbi:MAG: hypothetical protein M3Z30_05120 [Gemmatimonadota bacterium]|nr:hypothetical protein [Gemmatimonadota bacterium]
MREVKQIAGPSKSLAALCDDGTIWIFNERSWSWSQLPPVPAPAGAAESVGASEEHDELVLSRQEKAQQAIRERFEGTH